MKYTLFLPAILIGATVYPVTRVGTEVGNAPMERLPVASVVGRRMVSAITAYTKSETCPDTQCTNAGGKVPVVGTVACPRPIKLGTLVEILGVEYTCMDRTAKKYDGRFDIWMESHEEALKWGIRKLEVTIHEEK